MSSKTRA
jgi:hypothetical protein